MGMGMKCMRMGITELKPRFLQLSSTALLFVHSKTSRLSCWMGIIEIWELLDRKLWQWDLSFRWESEWDGNGNKVIEMGGICYEKSIPANLYTV